MNGSDRWHSVYGGCLIDTSWPISSILLFFFPVSYPCPYEPDAGHLPLPQQPWTATTLCSSLALKFLYYFFIACSCVQISSIKQACKYLSYACPLTLYPFQLINNPALTGSIGSPIMSQEVQFYPYISRSVQFSPRYIVSA